MKHIWWMLCWLLLGASVGVVVRALIHEDTPEEPVVRDITGICPTCGLVLPYAETRRIMVCQGHEFEEVIAVAGVQDDYMDVTIRDGDPNRISFDYPDLVISIPPDPPLTEIKSIVWGLDEDESTIDYDPDTNTIRLDNITADDVLRRMFYWMADERCDPNEYLMSAEIVVEENK